MAGVGGVAPGAPPKKTYQEFYSDPNEDPYTTLNSVLAPFSVPTAGAAARAPAAICEDFYASSNAGDPNAFLLLENRDPGDPLEATGAVTCYHRLTQYPRRPHVGATPWDELGFAFVIEVVHGQAQTVLWENIMFHQMPNYGFPQ